MFLLTTNKLSKSDIMDASVVVEVGSRRRTAAITRVVGKKILQILVVVGVSPLALLKTEQVRAFPVISQQRRNRRRTNRRDITTITPMHSFPSSSSLSSSSPCTTTTSLSSSVSSSSSSTTTTTLSSADSDTSSSAPSSNTATRSDAVIERVFNMLDRDNSGTITIDELTEFLQGKAPSEYSTKDVNTVFNNIDTDGSGCVSFAEFRSAMLIPGNTTSTNNDEEEECSLLDPSSLSCIVTQNAIADMVFMLIDKDNSGTIDFDELVEYLAPSASLSPPPTAAAAASSSSQSTGALENPDDAVAAAVTTTTPTDTTTTTTTTSINTAERTKQEITTLFSNMDQDKDGTISIDEFRWAMIEQCPRGYFIDSVTQVCKPLGPLGRWSQHIEVFGIFRQAYKAISTVFGLDHTRIQKLGVSFALSYSILSNLNGAVSFTAAWYISCKRTGMSPLVPGQWKSLMGAYGMIYGLIQLLKPFRVAAAIGMSKLSAEYLEMTQTKLQCNRGTAILCQYMMGLVMMGCSAFTGVSIVSYVTGVPIFG